MRTMVHAVEAGIRMTDPHGQSVFIDLIPEGVPAVGVEVTKMFPPGGVDHSVISFMIEITVPKGQQCPDCGHVHSEEHGELGEPGEQKTEGEQP